MQLNNLFLEGPQKMKASLIFTILISGLTTFLATQSLTERVLSP